MKNKVMHFLLGFFSFLLLWELLFLILQNHMLPSPIQVLLSMITEKNQLLLHGIASGLRILSSIFLALLIGLPIGILIGYNPSVKIVDPILYFIYPIPKVAFLPVFMILFGLGNISKIMLVVFIVVFQIIIAIRDGISEIPQDYILSAWTKMDYIEMFSGILTLGFLGILFFGLLDWEETRLVPWKE